MKLLLLGLIASFGLAEVAAEKTVVVEAIVSTLQSGSSASLATATGLNKAAAASLVQSAGFKNFAQGFKNLSAEEQAAVSKTLLNAAEKANWNASRICTEIGRIQDPRTLVNLDTTKLSSGDTLAQYVASNSNVAQTTNNSGILTSLAGNKTAGLDAAQNFLAQSVTLLNNGKANFIAAASKVAVEAGDYQTAEQARVALTAELDAAVGYVNDLNTKIEGGTATNTEAQLATRLNKDLGVALGAARTVTAETDANQAVYSAVEIIAQAYHKGWSVERPQGRAFNLALVAGRMVNKNVQGRLLEGASIWYARPTAVLTARHQQVVGCGTGVTENQWLGQVNDLY